MTGSTNIVANFIINTTGSKNNQTGLIILLWLSKRFEPDLSTAAFYNETKENRLTTADDVDRFVPAGETGFSVC